MSKDTELQRLEQFVEKLLAKYDELKGERNQLVKDLSDRNKTIAELEGNITNKDSERDQISLRVNKLVDQIEEWEQSLDDEDENSLEEATDELEEPDEEVAEQESGDKESTEEEDEGRVQHNLFSMSE